MAGSKRGVDLADCDNENELMQWAADVLGTSDLLTLQVRTFFARIPHADSNTPDRLKLCVGPFLF